MLDDLKRFCIDLAIESTKSTNAFVLQRECKNVLNEDISIQDIADYIELRYNENLLGINQSEMIKLFKNESTSRMS